MWVTKKYYVGFFLTFIGVVGVSQNTAIPDPNFEQELILQGFDTGPIDGFVPTANISGITNLDVASKNISDLTGIEAFTNLITLNCAVNFLTNLDLSKNTKLEELFMYNNQITSIDVTLLTKLKIFWCHSNQLSNLDVTKNTGLISLVCWDNNLTSLNTLNNPNLNVLVCEQNQITSLNVTNNKTLNRFQCGNNQLTSLNINNNTNLTYLSCEQNFLTTLNVNNNKSLQTIYCNNNQLAELDFTQNSGLTTLDCSNNELCKLNLRNGNNSNTTVNFINNINLNCVVVDNPSAAHATWNPATFSNYVSAQDQCRIFVNVDTLDSVFTQTTYTLPTLTYGNYFTQSGGTGTPLFAGDIINNSQIIYIYNESFCATNESSFSVLIITEDYYIPKYFTPNNDGIHDYWKVQDFNNSIKNISIFDRYGKLLKYLPTNSIGWNGSFKGELLKTDTYWYVISLTTGETIRGYFALKR